MNSDALRILFLSSLVIAQVVVFILEKKRSKPYFFDVEYIDNHAQWVYDNKLYYANIVNGKVDYKSAKEISLK